MNPFAEHLRTINDRLNLPQPLKTRIILEVSSDMQDLYEHHISREIPEKEAIAMAIKTFQLSDDALNQLTAVHESFLRRFFDHFSSQFHSRWERTVLFFLLAFIAFYTGKEFLSTQFYARTSTFAWPVMAMGFLAALLALEKFFTLYIRRDHSRGHLRSRLPLLFFLGVSSLFTGCFGVAVDAFLAIHQMISDMENSPVIFMKLCLSTSTLMIISLMMTIFTALLWYILMGKVSRIEQAEALILLELT